MNTLATELDLRSLPPEKKDKIADYVKSCELEKKNSATFKNAYNTCVQREQSNYNAAVVTGVGIVALIVGYFVGASTRGN